MRLKQPKGTDLNDLVKIMTANAGQKNEEIVKISSFLGKMDVYIHKLVEDMIIDMVPNIKPYSCRTEFMNQCYSILIYNADRQACVGTSMPLAEFLISISTPEGAKIQIENKIKKILKKFDETGISTGDRVNWIY